MHDASAPAADAIDLNQVALALSDALDLVGVEVVQHGKRVALLAAGVARGLGLPEDDVSDLFLAALLHDCGVSSTRVHQHLVGELDWDGTPEHCDVGARLLSTFGPFRRVSEIVRLHHTRWDAPARTAADPATARLANVVFLADRVDAFLLTRRGEDPLLAREPVRRSIGELGGTYFSEEVVDAFQKVAVAEAYWLSLEPHHVERAILRECARARPRPGPPAVLRQLAVLFAHVVDAKSPFTAEHSARVARLAALLGRLSGLPAETCEKLEVAGLLHDLGKLRVPDEILEKPAPLDEAEFAAVERHAFETYQILSRIPSLADVAEWAGMHHEGLRSTGYPFRRLAEEIPVPARLLAIADVFQALVQRRPYRDPLPPADVLGQLRRFVEAGQLDGEGVKLVEANFVACWEAATGRAGGFATLRVM